MSLCLESVLVTISYEGMARQNLQLLQPKVHVMPVAELTTLRPPSNIPLEPGLPRRSGKRLSSGRKERVKLLSSSLMLPRLLGQASSSCGVLRLPRTLQQPCRRAAMWYTCQGAETCFWD